MTTVVPTYYVLGSITVCTLHYAQISVYSLYFCPSRFLFGLFFVHFGLCLLFHTLPSSSNYYLNSTLSFSFPLPLWNVIADFPRCCAITTGLLSVLKRKLGSTAENCIVELYCIGRPFTYTRSGDARTPLTLSCRGAIGTGCKLYYLRLPSATPKSSSTFIKSSSSTIHYEDENTQDIPRPLPMVFTSGFYTIQFGPQCLITWKFSSAASSSITHPHFPQACPSAYPPLPWSFKAQ